MAKKKAAPAKKIESVEETSEVEEAPTSFQLPDGTTTKDEDKYAKAWLALGGGLCALMGEDVKMHSFDPFVSVAWKEQMLIQLPPDFVAELVHKVTYLQWQLHNYEQRTTAAVEEQSE